MPPWLPWADERRSCERAPDFEGEDDADERPLDPAADERSLDDGDDLDDASPPLRPPCEPCFMPPCEAWPRSGPGLRDDDELSLALLREGLLLPMPALRLEPGSFDCAISISLENGRGSGSGKAGAQRWLQARLARPAGAFGADVAAAVARVGVRAAAIGAAARALHAGQALRGMQAASFVGGVARLRLPAVAHGRGARGVAVRAGAFLAPGVPGAAPARSRAGCSTSLAFFAPAPPWLLPRAPWRWRAPLGLSWGVVMSSLFGMGVPIRQTRCPTP
jgi:hypothetical protein